MNEFHLKNTVVPAVPRASSMNCLWLPEYPAGAKDHHAGFRTTFHCAELATIAIHISGASWFSLWVDGDFVGDGPTRHPADHPEYQLFSLSINPGAHTLAVHVHDVGESTERHSFSEPFLACEIFANGDVVDLKWKACLLPGFQSQALPMGNGHCWCDWLDCRAFPLSWREYDFDDSAWLSPNVVERFSMPFAAPLDRGVRHVTIDPLLIAEGEFAHTYSWGAEEQPLQFFLRELEDLTLPADGIWRRYDLGRVRLGRPQFSIEAPEGSILEFASSDSLRYKRVNPFFGYRGSPTANMDHYVAPGGLHHYFPNVPKGGRFLEIHVFGKAQDIVFHEESYVERCFFDVAEGAFACDDDRLNRIWHTGVETLRGCAEDAVVDCPTRERGQFVGDTLLVGMEIARSTWNDLSLFRRALFQAAQCARSDGMIAGCPPGWQLFLPTYSLQWISAALRYVELTGEHGVLEELFPALEKNTGAFDRFWTAEGLVGGSEMDVSGMGWAFVDWGYEKNDGPSDMALNLRYLEGLRSHVRWCHRLNRDASAAQQRVVDVEALCRSWIMPRAQCGDWRSIGYHKTAIALSLGLLDSTCERPAVEFLKEHILACFPNLPDAPRVAHIQTRESQVITPYFFHFVMPLLIERGESAFVLEQYRRCWGWMLDMGATTWFEVFDIRWSHCHHWSGCPTWQLSHYALGLNRRFDLGRSHYDFCFRALSLDRASGHLPEGIYVTWERQGETIHYHLRTSHPITLYLPLGLTPGPLTIESEWSFKLPASHTL